jgi:hypothetical protein
MKIKRGPDPHDSTTFRAPLDVRVLLSDVCSLKSFLYGPGRLHQDTRGRQSSYPQYAVSAWIPHDVHNIH